MPTGIPHARLVLHMVGASKPLQLLSQCFLTQWACSHIRIAGRLPPFPGEKEQAESIDRLCLLSFTGSVNSGPPMAAVTPHTQRSKTSCNQLEDTARSPSLRNVSALRNLHTYCSLSDFLRDWDTTAAQDN